MEIGGNLSEKAKADLQIVNKALLNDQNAFGILMKRYKDTIYFMALKMVKDSDDAEDVTMEIFSKAFLNIKQYTPNYAFSTWLFKIASNHCIDFLRKKRAVFVSIDQGFEDADGDSYTLEIEADVKTPYELAVSEERNDILQKYVSMLKPRYQKLVKMRYFEELSYQEISDKLDLPVGTVKAQLFRSREYLLNIMQDSKEAI
ncbi:MAG: sigma-70 family RNA polymerase sigma factor [Luteibaculaceae bacterium]